MPRRVFGVVFACLVFFSDAALGQTPEQPLLSPAAVADSFLSRIARKEFRRAVELVDSASLEEFKRTSIASLRLQDSVEKMPVPRRTDVPPAVAAYFEAQAARYRLVAGPEVERQFGVRTVADVERMSAAEVFARWLESEHPDTQMRQALRAQGRDSLAGVILPMIGLPRSPTVLGAVTISDSLAYVLFQEMSRQLQSLEPGVLPLRRTAAGWRVPAAGAESAIRGGMCSIAFSLVETEPEVP
jgi:hypothetical protein